MRQHDFPRWPAVYQQTQRWLRSGCFAAIVHDRRLLLRLRGGGQPTVGILDSRTVQSTPESGARAGYDGYKRRNGSKTHVAVDTLGHLLAVVVTPANAQERAQVAGLAQQVQAATGNQVELAWADDGYTGDAPRKAAAAEQGITLQIVKRADAQGPRHGFVLLPKCWIVERSFAWAARFRRLARDCERLSETVAGLTFLAFTCLMLQQFIQLPCGA
jgi:transposase